MKVLVVDDEALARSRLKDLLSRIDGVEVIGEASNGIEAHNEAYRLKPDVMLLDIRMPGMDGIDAAREIAKLETPPAIIFCTAFGDYALEAFEANAVDYVLKPVRKERLEEALGKAKRVSGNQIDSVKIDDDPDSANKKRAEILCRVRGNLELIPLKEILYFKADQKYVTIKYYGGEVLIEESLKSLEDEFEKEFIRVHRSTLVAKEFLTGLEKTGPTHYQVILRHCDDRLEVSRRHVPEVRKFLRGRGD